MRVLIAHNRYKQAGGEDTAVANEHALLAKHSCDTRLWSVSNNVIDGAWRKISTAVRTPYSWRARDEAARLIAEFKPQIVHVHNFFPLLSPSIYDASRAAGAALVQTLHNSGQFALERCWRGTVTRARIASEALLTTPSCTVVIGASGWAPSPWRG